MKKQIFKISVVLLMVFFGLQSCRKEAFDHATDQQVPELVTKAQTWVRDNQSLSAGSTLDYSTLDFDWQSYSIAPNAQGIEVLSVPVANHYQPGKEYMELVFVTGTAGGAGTVKHYIPETLLPRPSSSSSMRQMANRRCPACITPKRAV